MFSRYRQVVLHHVPPATPLYCGEYLKFKYNKTLNPQALKMYKRIACKQLYNLP